VADSLTDQLRSLRIERTAAPPPAPKGALRAVVVIGVAAVVVAAASTWAYRRFLGAAPVVGVVYARAETGGKPVVGAVLSGAGYVISADKYISIGVRVPGRIEKYFVEEGDHVEPGKILVQLDARDYRAQVGRAEAAVALARANTKLASQQRERARNLFQEGVVSKDEIDQAESRADVGAATVRQSENELAAARANLDDTVLRSPVHGVVLAKLKTVGEIAVPGGFSGAGDLVRLADLSELHAEVDVSEADLANVHMGQEAEVVPDAYPQSRYAAKVVKLYPQVNRQKGTLKVEVRIEAPDGLLLPDMSARVTFLAAAKESKEASTPIVLASRTALRKGPGGDYVWSVVDGKLRKRPISVGQDLGENVQVASGLTGGEALAVGAEEGFAEGMAVAILPSR
jgi:RND family efflux transporter MFP subunit